MHVGIPVAPVSPAYSTQSRDFAKLKTIISLIEPAVVYVSDPARYRPRAGGDSAAASWH
jgi:feruloyl-CoA synthase